MSNLEKLIEKLIRLTEIGKITWAKFGEYSFRVLIAGELIIIEVIQDSLIKGTQDYFHFSATECKAINISLTIYKNIIFWDRLIFLYRTVLEKHSNNEEKIKLLLEKIEDLGLEQRKM